MAQFGDDPNVVDHTNLIAGMYPLNFVLRASEPA